MNHNEYELIHACRLGNLELIKKIIKSGVNIHVNNDEAICQACWRGDVRVVKYLVEHGANIQVNNGRPMRNAINNLHSDIEDYLKIVTRKRKIAEVLS